MIAKTSLFLVLIASLVFALPSIASANSASWDQLSAKEKRFLQKYHDKWDTFSSNKRKLLKQRANLSNAQWQNIKSFFRKWQKLSKAKKQRLKKVIRNYKKQSPSKKKRLRKMQKWVNSLPPNIRATLKSPAWKEKSPQERKAYINELKKKYPLK